MGVGVSNANHDKGAKAERDVAKYLSAWWPQARRALGAGRKDDRGDIHGVPYTVVQVKDCEALRLPKWVQQTSQQRANEGAPFCLLVVKKKYKPTGQWDAYVPAWLLTDLTLDESEAWTWFRMDLALAVVVLERQIVMHAAAERASRSLRSLRTTVST